MPTSTSSAPITSTTASVALPPDALAAGPAAGGTAGDGAGGDTWADATPVMSPSSTRTDAAKNSLVLSIVGHPLRREVSNGSASTCRRRVARITTAHVESLPACADGARTRVRAGEAGASGTGRGRAGR